MAEESTTENVNDASQPLTFTADEAGSTVAMTATGDAPAVTLEYTTDSGQTWLPFVVGETVVTLAEIGNKVSIRAGAAGNERISYNYSSFRGNTFTLTGSLSASGSVDSLLTQDPVAYAAGVQLSEGCYTRLFYNCKALKAAPVLPSTQLGIACYKSMFAGTEITVAPALPATDLTNACYNEMFSGCTSLTEAPALPATKLAESCYTSMFSGCTSLTEAPYLPAPFVATKAYDNLFNGCTSLTYVKAEFEYLQDTNSWLAGVSDSGTIDLPVGCVIWRGTANGIPDGWTVVTRGTFDHEPDLLTFTAEEAGATVTFYWPDGPDDSYDPYAFLYTTDGVNWLSLINGTEYTLPAINSTFQIAAWRKDTGLASVTNPNGHASFYFTGAVAASGNVNSLCNPNPSEEDTLRLPRVYEYLFSRCDTLTRPPDLPSTGLTESCYSHMFDGCTSMKSAPALPATTMAESCYSYMFNGCLRMESAPVLPATTLAASCYESMFCGCPFTQAPALPATTLAPSCYRLMFSICTQLTEAPALPAKTLAESCYAEMFSYCLFQVAPVLPATTLAPSCYQRMFEECTELVGLTALPATTLAVSCYEGMFRGCTKLQWTIPLPATTLVDYCYREMFAGCSSLGSLFVGFRAWADDVGATSEWVSGAPPSGEFHCRRGLPRIYDNSHIPGTAPASN